MIGGQPDFVADCGTEFRHLVCVRLDGLAVTECHCDLVFHFVCIVGFCLITRRRSERALRLQFRFAVHVFLARSLGSALGIYLDVAACDFRVDLFVDFSRLVAQLASDAVADRLKCSGPAVDCQHDDLVVSPLGGEFAQVLDFRAWIPCHIFVLLIVRCLTTRSSEPGMSAAVSFVSLSGPGR